MCGFGIKKQIRRPLTQTPSLTPSVSLPLGSFLADEENYFPPRTQGGKHRREMGVA